MPAFAAAASCGLMAADGMPVMPIASGLRWMADCRPAPGSEALKTRFWYFQPAAVVAALTPWVIFSQIGSSHCSQKNVLPCFGAAFMGRVMPTLVGGLVIGLGVDTCTCDEAAADVEVPLFPLDPLDPQAATVTPRAATAGTTIARYHVPFVISLLQKVRTEAGSLRVIQRRTDRRRLVINLPEV